MIKLQNKFEDFRLIIEIDKDVKNKKWKKLKYSSYIILKEQYKQKKLSSDLFLLEKNR